jgi:hypothetical protein
MAAALSRAAGSSVCAVVSWACRRVQNGSSESSHSGAAGLSRRLSAGAPGSRPAHLADLHGVWLPVAPMHRPVNESDACVSRRADGRSALRSLRLARLERIVGVARMDPVRPSRPWRNQLKKGALVDPHR